MTRSRAATLLLAMALVGAGAEVVVGDQTNAGAAAPAPLSAMAQLGQKMFFDAGLSASGRQSCASCHVPYKAFAPDNALAVQLGGPDMKGPGIRATPSLGYMTTTPPFSIGPESLFEVEGQPTGPTAATLTGRSKAALAAQAQANPVPEGGFFWDGRADTLEEQPMGPLLSPFEMANASVHEVVDHLEHAAYVDDFRALFGPHVFDDEAMAMGEASFALARYEAEDPGFSPFSSKYDAYLAGKARLTADEAAGLKLFDDPKKGNCSSCHLDKPTADGRPPVFTDFEYEALGLPRNRAIPANADPTYFDLGICGPMRKDDFAKQAANCGLFKTPTLRNVATRQAFFHNGVFHRLEDVLDFYVERDIHPETFYPRGADGKVDKFDDLPALYHKNIDVIDAPFDRHPGQQPALDAHERQQIIAFLKTLTDGYKAP
ncbi:MAG: cytochrome c peroxidase [Devosia sp.]|nr:cytochrome c peroxidase [Devosia sp.]